MKILELKLKSYPSLSPTIWIGSAGSPVHANEGEVVLREAVKKDGDEGLRKSA